MQRKSETRKIETLAEIPQRAISEPRSKSKAIFNDKRSTSSSSSVNSSSIWNWKPLKALSNIRNRRFDCRFTLQVHSVHGLSSSFNGDALCVRWKRNIQELGLCTRQVIVSQGIAKFDETLEHKCDIYVSRSGPHHTTKYQARQFVLYVSVVGKPEIDLGKHRVDLTRLLPLTLEELEEGSSGKWSTSFKLWGKGKNAYLNVGFGFSVLGNGDLHDSGGRKKIEADGQVTLRKSGSAQFRKRPSRSTEVSPISISENLNGDEEINVNRRDNRVGETRRVLDGLFPVDELTLIESGKRGKEGDNHVSEISAEEEVEGVMVEHGEISVLGDVDVKDWRSDEEEKKVDAITNSDDIEERAGEDEDDEDEEKIEAQTSENDIAAREVPVTVYDRHWREKKDDDDVDDDLEKVDTWKKLMHDIEERAGEDEDDEDEEKIEAQTSENDIAAGEVPVTVYDRHWREKKDDDDDDVDDDDIVGREEQKTVSNERVEDQRHGDHHLDHHDVAADHSEEEIDTFLNQINESDGEIPFFDLDYQEDSSSDTDLLLHELESALEKLPLSESEENENQSFGEDSYEESNYMDDVTESVTSEFLSMLDLEDSPIDSNPESPRERLWQEFRSESLLDLESIFDQKLEDFDLSSFIEDAEAEVFEHESRGRVLEHEEAEALMHELGFNEDSFRNSPVDFSTKNLGPLLRTKDGGFLRSMKPSLMMQVSSPVVVPAEIGSSAMEILGSLASVGIEKLSVQASKLMPLEDITGKTIQQFAAPSALNESKCKRRASSGDRDYVSLEELAPLAMEKIEALSIEGLRIQSGMSDKDAPVDLEYNGAVGLHLQKVNACGDKVDDGLMDLSISLEEWIKLDSGIIDEDQITERTSKILSAHQAKRERSSRRKKGILGNNFTVALMVQLRDPIRNFEPVGSPMLSLIQVERVLIPPKPRLYYTVSDEGNSEEVEVNTPEVKTEEEEVNAAVPQFKITGVHIAGLKSDPRDRKSWGSSSQRQTGSRWLAANGMGKANKHPQMKSTPGETLWSISSRINVRGSRWNELPAHKRNPNILLPK